MTDPNPTIRMPTPEPPLTSPPEPPPTPAPVAAPAVASPPVASQPVTHRPARTESRTGPIVFGVILVVIGAWFFAEQTLDLDLPSLDLGELWPVILIAIGAWVVWGSMRNEHR